MNSSEDYNPIEHFQKWFHEVDQTYPEDETNTMLLSTIGLDGFPKSRIVLLKRFTWEGFIFFTNYRSEKGKSIAENNQVLASFNWKKSKKEVHIYGRAEKIPDNLSDGYFESRPDGSKLSAWASEQSKVVPSRKELEERLEHYETKFKSKEIPRPDYWGGYMIKPEIMEFIEQDPLVGFGRITKYKLQIDLNWSKSTKFIQD